MKKILITTMTFILCMTIFTGCASKEEIEIADLNAQIEELKTEKQFLEDNIESFKKENDAYNYTITINIKQSHFTLDIKEHLKDSMNEISFDIPVSKTFYDSVEIGDVLDDSFRMGSFIFTGSIGSWDITITDKKIV